VRNVRAPYRAKNAGIYGERVITLNRVFVTILIDLNDTFQHHVTRIIIRAGDHKYALHGRKIRLEPRNTELRVVANSRFCINTPIKTNWMRRSAIEPPTIHTRNKYAQYR
jgi:hypothetical protein